MDCHAHLHHPDPPQHSMALFPDYCFLQLSDSNWELVFKFDPPPTINDCNDPDPFMMTTDDYQ